MRKRFKIAFYIALFSFIMILTFKDSINEYKLYNSTLDHYYYNIDKVNSISFFIHRTHLKNDIRVNSSLDDNSVIDYLKYSISNSNEDSRDKRVFDYMGKIFLYSNNKNMITISFDFDHDSDSIWFKLHKQDEVYGVYYKYYDADMYWHDLFISILESETDYIK